MTPSTIRQAHHANTTNPTKPRQTFRALARLGNPPQPSPIARGVAIDGYWLLVMVVARIDRWIDKHT
ncbi:MAG: hypothetical protein ACI30J_05395 [Paludibacteraceae bacterium]